MTFGQVYWTIGNTGRRSKPSKKSSTHFFQNIVLNFFCRYFSWFFSKQLSLYILYMDKNKNLKEVSNEAVRPKARGLAQHGGPPGWLEECDPAGCDLVRDGRSLPPVLIACPGRGLIYY
jgi:hypothetical protein